MMAGQVVKSAQKKTNENVDSANQPPCIDKRLT